jgi:hypothetical protein
MFRHAGPMTADRETMQPDIALLSLVSLAHDGTPQARRAHGLGRVDPIVPGGHYRRRPVAYVDLAHLLPVESIFRLHLDNHYQAYGPVSRYVLRDAVVTEQGAVLTSGGALVEESCWEFLVHHNLPFGLARTEAAPFRMTETPSRTVTAPSLLLKRPWWRNYGHFLVDAAALFTIGFLIYGPVMLIGVSAVDLVPKKAAGTAAGFTGFFGYVFGAVIAELGLGRIVDRWGWDGGFYLLLASCFISVVLFAATWKMHHKADR